MCDGYNNHEAMRSISLLSFYLILCIQLLASDLSLDKIPAELLVNADCVIRNQHIDITIKNTRHMVVRESKMITLLNDSKGSRQQLVFRYDKNINIVKLSATIYNKQGHKIKSIRKKDFRDYSGTSGSTLHSDNRLLYYDFLPDQYPVTIEYNIQYIYESTAFIPSWYPIESYRTSVIQSTISISAPSNLGLKIKASRLDEYLIKENTTTKRNFRLTSQPAIVSEPESMELEVIGPSVQFALKRFSLNGVEGRNNDWNQLGRWYDQTLLSGRGINNQIIHQKISEIVEDKNDNYTKAEAVYRFIQDNFRYVSIQLGIGGWKPEDADDVYKDGYGDCKGLTNLTMSMLRHLNIEAYYAIITMSERPKVMDKQFSRMEGNHVILYLPDLDGKNDYWLECTSQSLPFGYVHDKISDRNAFVIKGNHSQLMSTPTSTEDDNRIISRSVVNLDHGTIDWTSRRYGSFFRVKYKQNDQLKEMLRNQWKRVQDIDIIAVDNDVEITPLAHMIHAELLSPSMITQHKEGMLIRPFSVSPVVPIVPRYRDKKRAFYIAKSAAIIDTIVLQSEAEIIVKEEKGDTLSEDWGSYIQEIKQNDDKSIVAIRIHKVYAGQYPAGQYSAYRNYLKKIKKLQKKRYFIYPKTTNP